MAVKRLQGRRYQVTTFNIKGVWFVLDTHDAIERGGHLVFPIMYTALSRSEAREIAAIRNAAVAALYGG